MAASIAPSCPFNTSTTPSSFGIPPPTPLSSFYSAPQSFTTTTTSAPSFSFPSPSSSFSSSFATTQNTEEDNNVSYSSYSHHENSKVATMNLKDKKLRLMERCQKQVKAHRNSVLQRYRDGSLTPREIKSNLLQLISSEQASMSIDGANKLAHLEELEGEEYQAIMTFLEEALFEGLRKEESELLATYYEDIRKLEEEEDQEVIRQALESSCTDPSSFVICPVCKQNRLLENHHIILCACGVRIDTKQDDVNLSYLRERLCELFQIHGGKCGGQLQFSCSKECYGVPSMLFMNCDQCLCNEIVL